MQWGNLSNQTYSLFLSQSGNRIEQTFFLFRQQTEKKGIKIPRKRFFSRSKPSEFKKRKNVRIFFNFRVAFQPHTRIQYRRECVWYTRSQREHARNQVWQFDSEDEHEFDFCAKLYLRFLEHSTFDDGLSELSQSMILP